MGKSRGRGWLAVAVAAAGLGTGVGPLRGADDPPAAVQVVPSAEARAHVGERVTVELTVRASKNSEKRRTYFLDAEADYRDPKNVAVLIAHDHAAAFAEAGVADPSEFYRDRTIRVTGTPVREDEQVRIHVTDPAQIRVVDTTPAP